ncbi:MAG: hypothetical protein CMB13_02200 [Euryarchaeota archaeon]|nr:hypothetical protein [Euryarchaeota archaeon]|tara:strand:+ start:505 stop:927 length:423 start_codon:yes stop_codon:yes gene_type:complete
MTVDRDDIDDEANGSNEEVPDISTWVPLDEQSEYQDEAMIAIDDSMKQLSRLRRIANKHYTEDYGTVRFKGMVFQVERSQRRTDTVIRLSNHRNIIAIVTDIDGEISSLSFEVVGSSIMIRLPPPRVVEIHEVQPKSGCF